MSSSMKEFAGGVLRVTVQHVYYPVTEEVLHQVFEAYGVVQISVFQRVDHVEADVQLRSRNGAARALALHGRCIYEGCCLLDVQDVSPAATTAKSDLGELCEQIRDQLQKLSEMMHTASRSTSSSSPEIINEESGREYEHTHSDICIKVAAPVVCVIDADPSSLAAPTPTSCSMVCPSSDAIVDVFPKLPASAESDEDLDLDSAAVAPATYPTGVMAVLRTMPSSSTGCPRPSPDRNFSANGVPRPLPWPSFPCDGDGKRLTYSWPATQGTLLCLQPKPPWYSYQALLSKEPRCWEHLYICGDLNLLASCWNFSSYELYLYGNDWFMGYTVTYLVVQKNWDPGGIFQSGSGPLTFPRCFCLSWDPCLTETNNSMEKLRFHKFHSVCKATYIVTHQLDPRILVGIFQVHSVSTLKFIMVCQYTWKVQIIDYLLFGVKEWVQNIQYVQPSSVVYHALAVWCEQHIAGTALQVFVNTPVLDLQAREWSMGDVSEDFYRFSRVQLLRPPSPPLVPEVFRNHTKWLAGSVRHMPQIVLWIFSRNELMDKCCITCMLKWELFRLISDQGQGEQFICSARKSVEVTLWMNNSDIAELACCTSGHLMFSSVARLLSYHGEDAHADCKMIKASSYKMEAQHNLGDIGHSCFPRLWLPNKILVVAQEKSHSWRATQGKRSHLCKIDEVHLSSSTWVHMGVFRLDVAGQFLRASCVVQSMRYIVTTHYLGTSTLLSREGVSGLLVPAVRCSLGHGSSLTIKRIMPIESVENRSPLTSFCIFVCGIRLWNPGISQLIASFSALTCSCRRAYFSGSDFFYDGLDCDIRLGYWGHMAVMPFSLFWFATWHTYKVQPAQNYMKFSMDNIARAFLKLYSSRLEHTDYEIHASSASGHMWAPCITVLSGLHGHVQMFISRLGYVIYRQSQGTIGSAVMLLQNLQPTLQLFAPLLSLQQAEDRVQHSTFTLYLCGYSTIPSIQYDQVHICSVGKQYLPPGGGISHNQRFCIELGVSNATRHIHQDCHFFPQLVIHTKIIYTNLLLPYDPVGIALWLDKFGGISDSRLFIIGLRASRISREEECNTPVMGCHHVVCNLGLGYEMGRVPLMCTFCRSNISARLVSRTELCGI